MSMTKEQIVAEAMALAPPEREEIADALFASLAGTTPAEIDDACLAESQRRYEEYKRGEVTASPDPDVLGGKPCIAGRRISVEHVIVWHLRENQPIEKIARNHDLSPASIHAALTYYYNHGDELDHKMAATTP